MGTRLLIIGPPGAGKGTQAAILAEALNIPAISTGDIFRANIKNETPLGLMVKVLIAAGDYVPDSLTNSIVADRLNEKDAREGFLLDGYPRTVDQVGELDRILGESGQLLDAVILLEAATEVIVERLLKRAKIEGRIDDTEEVIRHRMKVYEEQTAALIDTYADRDLVVSVDGLGSVDEVSQKILTALEGKGILPAHSHI